LLDLPSDLQRAALLHEVFHVVRRDWVHLLAEQVVETVFWFHPAMRWAVGKIQLSREQTIDALVVLRTGRRGAYVKALLSFADLEPAVSVAAPLLGRHHLAQRIRAITKPMSRSAASTFVAVTGLALAAAGSVLAAVSLMPLQNAQSNETIYEAGNGVSLPVVLTEVRPVYTEEAKAAKIEGRVTMSCVVRTDGHADDITVVESLDSVNGLDDAAVDALRPTRSAVAVGYEESS
jgi:D-alanyl-D-alanine endopeptidase (penicillin-binding protein 7)